MRALLHLHDYDDRTNTCNCGQRMIVVRHALPTGLVTAEGAIIAFKGFRGEPIRHCETHECLAALGTIRALESFRELDYSRREQRKHRMSDGLEVARRGF